MARKSYWIEGLASKGNDIREIEVAKDGLLFRSDISVIKELLAKRPRTRNDYDGRVVWFFNSTQDREIAEMKKFGSKVTFNPSLLWSAGFEITT